jgi:hypothetical protein
VKFICWYTIIETGYLILSLFRLRWIRCRGHGWHWPDHVWREEGEQHAGFHPCQTWQRRALQRYSMFNVHTSEFEGKSMLSCMEDRGPRVRCDFYRDWSEECFLELNLTFISWSRVSQIPVSCSTSLPRKRFLPSTEKISILWRLKMMLTQRSLGPYSDFILNWCIFEQNSIEDFSWHS